jgi:hypothetical protein
LPYSASGLALSPSSAMSQGDLVLGRQRVRVEIYGRLAVGGPLSALLSRKRKARQPGSSLAWAAWPRGIIRSW